MKKTLLTNQKQIERFFNRIGVDYDGGFKYYCGQDLFVHSKSGKDDAKKYKIKEDDRVVEGYATTPNVDWVKDSVTMDAIKDAAKHLLKKGTNTVFFNHDQNMPVGKVINAMVDKVGLFITVIISKAKDVEDIWTKVKEEIIGSFSIRFITKAVEVVRNNAGEIVRWDIKKIQILEVSLAPLPMNSTANITNVSGKSMKDLGKSNSNIKNRSKGMKKTDTKTGAITEMVKELVKDAFEENRKALVDDIKSLLPKTKEDVEKETVAEAKKAAKAKVKAEKAKDDKIKALEAEVKELKGDDEDKDEDEDEDEDKDEAKAKVKKQVKSKKKGEQDESEDSENDGEVKKALKDIDDEATCIFVLKAMDSEDIYNALTDSEKDKVKQLYFQMLKSEKKI